MGYTINQYGALAASIAQGALSVKYADKEVTYRNLDDMIRIKRLMEAELFPTQRRPTRRYGEFSKGIYPSCGQSNAPYMPVTQGSVQDATGLVLTAPNGTQLRVTANDDGTLSTTVL